MRKFGLIGVAVTVSLLISGCSGSAVGSGNAGGAGEKIQIRVAHQIAADSPLQAGAEKFKELLETSSDGRFEVSIYPASQLGSEVDVITQVQSDSLEVGLVSPAIMSNVSPEAAVFSMPYVIAGDSEKEQYANLRSVAEIPEVVAMTEAIAANYNMRAVDWSWWYGNRHVTNSTRAIDSINDLKGLKLRTPDAPIHFLAIEAMGASPTPMAFSELYLALQTGAVDGQENPYSTIETGKFFEVQKHLAVTGHLTQGEVVLFSEAFWQRLSSEDQKLIQDAVQEAGVYQSEIAMQDNAASLDRLQNEHGLKITYPDVSELRAQAESIATKWAETNSGFDLDTYQAIVASQR